MSRYFGMEVSIAGHAPARAKAIRAAAGREWPFEDWRTDGSGLAAYAQDYLYGGETEEDFALRLAQAIWRANGVYCQVRVNATYLEVSPSELHCPGKGDYRRLVKHRPARRLHRQKRR